MSVPIRLPSTRLPVDPDNSIATPSVLPEMRLRVLFAVPPIVLPIDWINTPAAWKLPIAPVPLTLAPIRLPSTRASPPTKARPAPLFGLELLAEIRLPGAVPG